MELTVPDGTVFGLLGPNSVGKTTTGRIATTLLKPDAGQVRVAGFDVVSDATRLCANISASGQYAAVDDHLTGAESLEMVGRLYHLGVKRSRQRARELLERFDLTDTVDRLSGTATRPFQIAGEQAPTAAVRAAAIRTAALSCQRLCQHGNGPASERSAIVADMNGSAVEAPESHPGDLPRTVQTHRLSIPLTFATDSRSTIMSVTLALTDQDKLTLRLAAWGAVSLMSAAGAAGSAHKVATQGSIALTSATGPVGHVLAKAPKGVKYGKTVADLADQVLPALTTAMTLLKQQDPAEAGNFRSTVIVAIDAATQGRPSPTLTEMARKITETLDAA